VPAGFNFLGELTESADTVFVRCGERRLLTHTAHDTRFADKHKRDDVEGKKSAVDVAVVTFFAFSLFSFFLSEISFIGEKKKKRIDDEFVTGGGGRGAICDGDDDDTER
jgi:hypothetical protein